MEQSAKDHLLPSHRNCVSGGTMLESPEKRRSDGHSIEKRAPNRMKSVEKPAVFR